MRKLLLLLPLLFYSVLASGQELTLQEDSLFTTPKSKLINDYSMIGVNYGMTFSNTYFSPSKHNRSFVTNYNYASLMYTKHCKMFGNLPYFAFMGGVAMGNEGYAFEADEETGSIADVDGATWCSIKVFEVPVFAQIHIDSDPIKIMANIGVYGGWRESITRSGPTMDITYANTFRDYERRIDYGLQGGVGIAYIMDPLEFHLNCHIRWGWSSLYEPDYSSIYYYYYAYPLDIIVSFGVHFQLTKRSGNTKKQLKRQAYEYVYGTTQDHSGTNR